MIDLMSASPAERSAYGSGALAGQSRGAYAPPSDAALSAAYTEGFSRNGGRLPKSATPRGAQVTTKRISADPEGLLLARCLRDPRGRALVQRFAQLLSIQLSASSRKDRVSVRLAWEMARAERSAGPEGSNYKADNRLVGPLARWAILCARNDLRGRIEVRGEPDPSWHKAEGPRPTPYPWLDTAKPFEPLGSYGVTAPAPFSGTLAQAASAIDPDDTDALFPAPEAR